MPEKIRKILQEQSLKTMPLSKHHRKKFEIKLQRELHGTTIKKHLFFKMAASFLLLVGLGSGVFYFSNRTVKQPLQPVAVESLGSVSPQLKSIEAYYLVSINAEILNLQQNHKNKGLVDGYLEKIGALTLNYKALTKTLNTRGLNEKTINAMIANLQLRLKLLLQLNTQLNELKTPKSLKNENTKV